MNNLAELRAQAQRLMNEYPTHQIRLIELYNNTITKIMNGGDEPTECTLMLEVMLELVA